MPRLERLAGPTTTPEEVQSILDRDGAVIVEEAIGTQLLAGLNSDLDGFVDDLGVGDLSCYGAEDLRTPRLDALVAAGMRFDNAYSNCPVCSPTRACRSGMPMRPCIGSTRPEAPASRP